MNYKTNTYKTQITRVPTESGESIEQMLRRLNANNEPIPDTVPPIYTPKEEGVIGDYDIRHDRFNTAIEASDKFAASEQAKAANKGDTLEEPNQEPTQGKEE